MSTIPEAAKQATFKLIDEITCGIILNQDEPLAKWENLQVGNCSGIYVLTRD